MKKISYLFIICVFLIGCVNVSSNTKKDNKQENIEKYSLVSSENRLVFKNENSYEIIYYENDKIVKVESAIKFDTPEEAKKYYTEESYGSSDIISCVYDVFIVEETEEYWEDYKDLNVDEIKQYMEKADYTFID